MRSHQRSLILYFIFTSICTQVSSDLGPPPPQNGECTRESCQSSNSGHYSEHKQHPPGQGEEDSESNQGFEVAEVPGDQPGFMSLFYSAASSGLSTVYHSAKSAKDNFYDKAANMTSDFADTIRAVIHEEVYNLLESIFSTVGIAFTTPGAVFYRLGQTAMSVTLCLLCLLFSYIFLRYFSLLFVLAFDASIFLLHRIVGPKVIFGYIFSFGGYAASILWFMVRHYYITSILIVACFAYSLLYSLVLPIIRWSTGNTESQKRERMLVSIVDIHARMRTLENNQEEMLRILRRWEETESSRNDVSLS